MSVWKNPKNRYDSIQLFYDISEKSDIIPRRFSRNYFPGKSCFQLSEPAGRTKSRYSEMIRQIENAKKTHPFRPDGLRDL